MTDRLKPMLVESFDYSFDRLNKGLNGMTDEEYLWEPVPESMSIRREGMNYVMEPRLPESEEILPSQLLPGVSVTLVEMYFGARRRHSVGGDPATFSKRAGPALHMTRSIFFLMRSRIGGKP